MESFNKLIETMNSNPLSFIVFIICSCAFAILVAAGISIYKKLKSGNL